jgi:putative ABC transport system ATP-binding protein
MDTTLEPSGLSSDDASHPAVSVMDVSYGYGAARSSKPILNNVDFVLRRGEFVILTGPSGAGKTTLLTLVGALRSLQSGNIDVLGTELFGLSQALQREVRRKIGFIFQDHNLFDALTAFQTLRLATELQTPRPSREAALERSRAILAAIGMDAYLHTRPGELSTGQKQRIAIARALINDPPLILADEPTASLDIESSHRVINLIRRRIDEQKAAALMVTHDSRIFTAADRVVHMVDGRIVGVPQDTRKGT